MAQLMDYAHYLAKEIGPRPAGTEEEQQAALYITEQFQKEAGFTANIEEFVSTSNLEGGRAILAGVTVLVTILAMILPFLSIPAFVLAAASGALYVLEAFDRPVLSSRLARGASQNVIAKYQPNPDAEASGRMRSRKLVVVAHYDTGRVKPALFKRLEAMGLPIELIYVIGMVAAAFFLLVRIFVSTSGGGALVILNVLSVLALIVCLLPIVKTILMRTAPYNEGANNNATGTAALIEVARRISRGSVSEADLAQGDEGDVVIHGEEAARSAGLVPEGAQILYESEQIAPPAAIGEYDEEERLLAAKAAIAALTGKPVERKVYGSVADNLVNSRAQGLDHDYEYRDGLDNESYYVSPDETPDSGGEVNRPVAAVPAPVSAPWPEQANHNADGFENAPSWFIAAQQNAKKQPAEEAGEIHRSRYTEAMEQGERARREREEAMRREEQERREAEARAREEQASAAAAAYAQNLQDQARAVSESAAAEQEALDETQGSLVEATAFDEASADELELQGGLTEQAEAQPTARVRVAPEFEPAFAEEDFPDDPMLEIAYERGMRAISAVDEAAADVADEPASDREAAPVPDVIDVAPEAEEAASLDPDQTHAFPGYAQLDASVREAEALVAADDADAAASAARLDELGNQQEAAHAPGRAGTSQKKRGRHAISLPELDLDDPTFNSRNRVSDLPQITRDEGARADDPQHADKLRNLRTNVPSLSGVIRTKNEARKAVASSLPNVVNVPTPLADQEEPAASEAPLVEEELKEPTPRRRIVAEEEVDYEMEVPTDFPEDQEEEIAETEKRASRAGATPTRRSMPKSRAGGFFDRFRRKEEELGDTPQEWLNVDEDFDARSVGRDRGSWESFRDDRFEDAQDELLAETEEYGEFATNERRSSKRDWEGGAYSRMSLGHVDMRSGEDGEADEIIPDEPPEAEIGRSITGEIEQIYHFRNPSFNTEIWFVAIGSDTEWHDGAKAFLEAHRNELRGSMVIEVESLGAGVLSVASQEGALRKVNASSRIKRLTRDAIAKTGLALDEVSLAGTDSIASTIQKAGFQSMHLFGAENGQPALKGDADDVMDNVDELAFDDNVNFLFELLKSR